MTLILSLKLDSIMPYKMILNILILFLCTSCCTCAGNCGGDVEPFYISIKEKATREDAIIKYDIKEEEIVLIDNTGNATYSNFYITKDSINAFVAVYLSQSSYLENDNIYILKIKDTEIGKFRIETKSLKHSYCCIGNELDEFSEVDTTILIEKIPQEKNQPFYEIQF